jgi:alkylhydroperoxidase family enzyme
MKTRKIAYLTGLWLLSSAGVGAAAAARVPVLTDEEAWKKMTFIEKENGRRLPMWIRALAVSLPKTAAAMLDLDYAQRRESTLPPRLRAKLRWFAAAANRCDYAKAYARFDYLQAGGKAEDIDELPRQLDKLPEAERLALQLVKQLVEAAYTVTDEQMARLVKLYGEKQVVAIVLIAAYANFQDRLLLALGVAVEPDGPFPPVKVRFHKAPTADARSHAERGNEENGKEENGKEKPKRIVSPPAANPPPLPEKLDDPEWTALSFDALRQRMDRQIARRQARVRIPDWETVHANLPADMPQRDTPIRIKWSLLAYGYQPRLTAAWFGGLRAFREESDLERLYYESMFWVVTRSLQCFY